MLTLEKWIKEEHTRGKCTWTLQSIKSYRHHPLDTHSNSSSDRGFASKSLTKKAEIHAGPVVK